jgi:hypothetical protein
MSQIRVNNITNRTGIAGPSVAGIPVVNSNSHFVVPTGRTGQRYADDGENIVRDGLVLYLDAKYSYPGATGTNPDVYTWYDMSGNENNGELVGGVGYNSSNGGSLVFDDTNDHIISKQVLSETNSAPFTLEAWARTYDTGSGWQTVIGTNGSYSEIGISYGYFAAGRNGGVGNLFVVQSNSNPSYELIANTWYHMVLTYDGSVSPYTGKAYLNGEFKASGDMGYNGSNNGLTVLGSYRINPASELWDGEIAQARIYNRALSAAEVLQNYEATKSRFQ